MEKEESGKRKQRSGKAEQIRIGDQLSPTCDESTNRALWELARILRQIAETEQPKDKTTNENSSTS